MTDSKESLDSFAMIEKMQSEAVRLTLDKTTDRAVVAQIPGITRYFSKTSGLHLEISPFQTEPAFNKLGILEDDSASSEQKASQSQDSDPS